MSLISKEEPIVCQRCSDVVESRRVPFGKTGRYVEIIGCKCQAMRFLLRYEKTTFREDRPKPAYAGVPPHARQTVQ